MLADCVVTSGGGAVGVAARQLCLFCAVFVLQMAGPPAASTETAGTVLIPRGATEWRYVFSMAPGYQLPSYDDSGWAVGAAPFALNCGTPGTLWPANTGQLTARYWFYSSGTPSGTRFSVQITGGGANLFLNGFEFLGWNNSGCNAPVVTEFPFARIVPGWNLFVISMGKAGDVGHMEVELVADGVTPVSAPSFGALKSRYRGERGAAQPTTQDR